MIIIQTIRLASESKSGFTMNPNLDSIIIQLNYSSSPWNQTGKIDIKTHGSLVDNVTSYKYLGILLDSDLNFSMHIEYAVGKAKRASAKVSRLIEGDKGVPVHTGIELYKTLVRPHLQYALPVCQVYQKKRYWNWRKYNISA